MVRLYANFFVKAGNGIKNMRLIWKHTVVTQEK